MEAASERMPSIWDWPNSTVGIRLTTPGRGGMRIVRSQAGLLTGHPLGGGRPELVGVAGGEPALVDVDLVIDELQVFL
jgi:hypothetical protein